MTQHNLGLAYLFLSELADGSQRPARLEAAKAHVDAAFEVFDDTLPFYRDANTELADRIQTALSALD
jgi:hypothetical protein